MLSGQKDYINISGEAIRTLIKAFHAVIDNKDINSFVQLNGFLYDRLSSSFDHDNIKGFETFSGFFVWYYEYALKKVGTSITYKDIYDICADRSARGLKEKMGWGFEFRFANEKLSLDEKKKINRYSKILVNRFGELINVCLRHKDINHLSFILNELNQTSNIYNHQLSSLRIEISLKKRSNLQGAELKQLLTLEEQYAIESYLNDSVRLLFKVTLYWSFFLYGRDAISSNELLKVLSIFETYQGYLSFDFIEDLLMLRNFSHESEYVWGRWDYMDRPSGVTYSPPALNHWATFGALLYMLQKRSNFHIEIEDKSPKQLNALEYLWDSMLRILNALKDEGHEKWRLINNSVSNEEYNQNIGLLIDRINSLRENAVTAKEKVISELPLDDGYVQNFLGIMSSGWEKGNDVRQMFKLFDKIQEISNDEIKEMWLLGEKSQVWLGYKTTLIRNEEFHIPIYGLERRGAAIADTEENLFLGPLLQKSSEEADDVVVTVDKAIKNLVSSNYQPSIIICGLNIWFKYFQNLKSPDFIFDWNNKQGFAFENFGGTFKGIPILYFRTQLINNYIIVADVKAAFLLQQKVDEHAYQKVLHRKIIQITKERAEQIIQENPQFKSDNQEYEDAVVKVMNGVLVDFYLIEKFVIEDDKAFLLIRVDT